jgi:hypothetical protein
MVEKKFENMKLSDEARKLKNEYQKQWKARNRERVREYHRNWRKQNPDKVRANMQKYWERKVTKNNDVTLNDTLIVTVTSDSVTKCLNCGNEFQPQRKTAKFCCSSCRVKYNRNHG